MMPEVQLLRQLYASFNARDLEGALAAMHPGVVWANGLDGGHVHGHDGVRAYWTAQWATIESRAEPLDYAVDADGTTRVTVHLTARDRNGQILFDDHGFHVFRIEDGLIRRFDIEPAPGEHDHSMP